MLSAFCMQGTCHMGGRLCPLILLSASSPTFFQPRTSGSPVGPYMTGVRLGWYQRMDVSGVTLHKVALLPSRHHFGQERSQG